MKTILLIAHAMLMPFSPCAQDTTDFIFSEARKPIFNQYFRKLDYQSALAYSEATLDTILQLNPQSQAPAAYWRGRIGAAHLGLTQYNAAIASLAESLAYFSKQEGTENIINTAKLHQNLGNAYRGKGNYDSAKIELYTTIEILKNFENEEAHAVTLMAYSTLTSALAENGEHESLILEADAGDNLARKYFDETSHYIGIFHQNRGLSFYKKGQLPEARNEFDVALKHYQMNDVNRKSSINEIFNTLNNLGGLSVEIGDYESALDYCAQSIHLLESLGLPHGTPNYFNAYGNIGHAYLKLEDFKNAEYYFHLTIEGLVRYPDALPEVYASVYDGLGQTYLGMNLPQMALNTHQQGLLLVRKLFGISWRTAFMQYNIAKDFLTLGKQDSAMAHLEAAIDTYRKSSGGNSSLLSDIYRTSAEISVEKSRWVDALLSLDLAAAVLSDTSNIGQADFESRFMKGVHSTRANLFLKKYIYNGKNLADLQNAYDNLQSARYWLDRYRANLPAYNPEVLQNILDHTRVAEAILWEMYKAKPTQELADEMFETADRGKSQELFEQFRFIKTLDNSSLPLDSLDKLSKRMAIIRGRLAALTGTNVKVQDLRIKYQSDLAVLKRQYDTLLVQLNEIDPTFTQKRRELSRISRAQTQALLASDQCLLEYTITDAAIYIFLLRNDSMLPPIVVEKDPRFKIWLDTVLNICHNPLPESAAEQEIKQKSAQFAEAAHALYRHLLEPLRPHLTSRVTIIRDGELNYLPFEVLVDSLPPSSTYFHRLPFLLNKLTFSYENAAALYSELHSRNVSPTQHALILAPFANWSYKEWGKLDKSGNSIKNLCTPGQCSTYLDKLATKELLNNESPKYRFLHFFTHAQADSSDGKKSFILLRNPDGNTPDTIFAIEVFGLRLQAEIVALSACETSHGKLHRGEGIVCLAWAFTGAGARSLVTTLWKVEADIAVPFIFNEFYGYINILPRDSALRQAKLDYLAEQMDKGRQVYLSQPFYWAPFILTGENGLVKF